MKKTDYGLENNTLNQGFITLIQGIGKDLNSGGNFIGPELLFNFTAEVNNIAEKIEEITTMDRLMKIGIVGGVKAGKSSFLNALFFQGETILPKAPTPMTAALTKISYGEEPSAKIFFYQKNDWQRIMGLARDYEEKVNDLYKQEMKEYQNRSQDTSGKYREPTRELVEKKRKSSFPVSLSSAKELVDMVNDRGIFVDKYLGKVQELKNDGTTESFMEELQQYVGANGLLTPLVNYTEITINNPLLHDIQVIDTPGLNDPILSRSETTKKFLMSCDVVFLLSYVSQFMDDQDVKFLTTVLPRESVGRAIIIGSKFDSGVLDYSVEHASLGRAMRGSVDNFNSQARKSLESLQNTPQCTPMLKKAYEDLPPYYISSLLYGAARKKETGTLLTDEETNIITRLHERFTGVDDSVEGLYDLSNIEGVKQEVFLPITEKKEEILRERIEGFTHDQSIRLRNSLEEINIFARNNLEDLKNSDYEGLQEKLDQLTAKLNSIRSEVRNIFHNASVDAVKVLKQIMVDVEFEVDNHQDLEISLNTTKHNEIHKLGVFKKEVRTISTETKSAEISEVIRNLQRYATRVKKLVNEEYDRLFDIVKIKKHVKETVIGAFDLGARDFNENDILIPMEVVLKKLTIPSIDIDLERYDQLILSQFTTAVVESEKISSLRLMQQTTLQVMVKDIEETMNTTGRQVETILQEQAGSFVDNIEAQLKGNIKNIQNLLLDKAKNIQALEEYLKTISLSKEKLMKFQV